MSLLDSLFSSVAPHACLVCQKDGNLICDWCAVDAFEQVPSRCYRCKRLTSNYATCPSCRRNAPLKHVWVRTSYQGVPKQLVHVFKFERARAASTLIANAMAEVLPFLPPNTLVVPVPTATGRVRQRGYDQAVLLAQHIAKQTGCKSEQVIVRLTQSRQVGANRKHRKSQLEAAFYITKPKTVYGANILLIDDIITTGATLETVARQLKRAGAKSVTALTFAQAQ